MDARRHIYTEYTLLRATAKNFGYFFENFIFISKDRSRNLEETSRI